MVERLGALVERTYSEGDGYLLALGTERGAGRGWMHRTNLIPTRYPLPIRCAALYVCEPFHKVLSFFSEAGL